MLGGEGDLGRLLVLSVPVASMYTIYSFSHIIAMRQAARLENVLEIVPGPVVVVARKALSSYNVGDL